MPVSLFYSYAHEDEEFRIELEKHLSVLRRNGVLAAWHDRRISAGKEWRGEINKNLESAKVIVLLVSPDFLNSDYCYDLEMKRAIEKHGRAEARVVPIIIRPSYWEDAPFAKLQALLTGAKPVTLWSNRDEAWVTIVKGLKTVCDELTSEEANPTTTRVKVSSDQPRTEARSLKHAIFPFDVTVGYKKISIASDIHRYDLTISFTINRPPAQEGFMLELLWPSLVRSSQISGLAETGEVVRDRTRLRRFVLKSDQKIYPGQTIEVVGPSAEARIQYEFDNDIYYHVEKHDTFLYWEVYFNNSLPMNGGANFTILNSF